jgi:hypothetical protein
MTHLNAEQHLLHRDGRPPVLVLVQDAAQWAEIVIIFIIIIISSSSSTNIIIIIIIIIINNNNNNNNNNNIIIIIIIPIVRGLVASDLRQTVPEG